MSQWIARARTQTTVRQFKCIQLSIVETVRETEREEKNNGWAMRMQIQ